MIVANIEAKLNCGVYPSVPPDKYAAWPLLRRTAIDLCINKSLAHVKAYLDGALDDFDSPDLNFGRKYHMLLLEPERFRDMYPIVTSCSAIMKSGANKGNPCPCSPRVQDADGNWFCGKHAPEGSFECEFRVTPDELEQLEAMRAKVKANRVVNLLRQEGGCEVSIVWESGGLKIKSRLDKFIPSGRIPATIIDLKKTRSAAARDIERSIETYGYHRQAAMYIDAVKHATGEEADAIYIFQEDTKPYELAVKQIDAETLAVGRREYISAVQRINRAMETGEWPGYSLDIEPIGLPEWKLKQERRFHE